MSGKSGLQCGPTTVLQTFFQMDSLTPHHNTSHNLPKLAVVKVKYKGKFVPIIKHHAMKTY
jgi:hypothetical protein